MFYRYSPYSYLDLNICWGLFHLDLLFYCTICFPHVVLVSTSYSSRGFFIFFPYCFLKDILTIPYSL